MKPTPAKIFEVLDKYGVRVVRADGRLHLDLAELKSHKGLILNELGGRHPITLTEKIRQYLGW